MTKYLSSISVSLYRMLEPKTGNKNSGSVVVDTKGILKIKH